MNSETKKILAQSGISVEMTEFILKTTDWGRKIAPPLREVSLPDADDPAIVDTTNPNLTLVLDRHDVETRLAELGLAKSQLPAFLRACGISGTVAQGATSLLFDRESLTKAGVLLVPLVSFGILNGGSASSYFDGKKNQEFSADLYQHFAPLIETMAERYGALPKGLSPAFLQATQGNPAGPDFMVLKLRAWLLLIDQYQRAHKSLGFSLPWDGLERQMSFFQMVSRITQEPIAAASKTWKNHPLLSDLITQTGVDPSQIETGVQELIAAFTQTLDDGSRQIFLDAKGIKGTPLALPGGHGQNFQVLEPIYRRLRAYGKRFALLGNIDNMGSFPDPLSLAISALSPGEASFEFAFKTPLDRKGGVLVRVAGGRLSCADIGPAIKASEVKVAEDRGQAIFFNAATGLFKLNHLCEDLPRIIAELPIRFSNQDKDAGRYSQAEQVTWEVIGLLQKPQILGVAKRERMLAAKFFLDCILSSGLGTSLDPQVQSDKELLEISKSLNEGLKLLLAGPYGLKLENALWVGK